MLCGRRRTRRSQLLLCAFSEVEEQNRDKNSRDQCQYHGDFTFHKAKRHHQAKERGKDQAHAHCNNEAFEKVSGVIAYAPRKILVDVNRRESLDPGFAEAEALVAIDGDRLPPSRGDIGQQEWRKEHQGNGAIDAASGS
jgi:hypothetical protein